MAEFEIGTRVKIQATFTDESNAPADPTTVTLLIVVNRSARTTYTYPCTGMTKISTGVYEFSYKPTTVGQYQYRWTGDGSIEVSGTGSFYMQSTLG